MLKLSTRVVLLVLFGLALTAVAQDFGQPEPVPGTTPQATAQTTPNLASDNFDGYQSGQTQPQDFFLYVRDRAVAIARIVAFAERQYVGGKRPLWGEAYRSPALPYTAALNDILLLNKNFSGQTAYPSFPMTRWPEALAVRAIQVNRLLALRAGSDMWKQQLLSLHNAYVRTLVSVYVYMESLKREYLLQTSPELVFGRDRDALLRVVLDLHAQVQALMKCFEEMRKYAPLNGLMPYHSAYGKGTWEANYGVSYHYGFTLNVKPANGFVARDIAPYFAPFLPAPQPQAQPGGQGPIGVPPQQPGAQPYPGTQPQPDGQQGQPAFPQPGVQPAPGVQPQPGAQPPQPGTQPGAQSPRDQQFVPPPEPSYVENNNRLRQLILSLQNRLATPEVQANPALKKQIEEILRELRPGLPALKPLPPQEGGGKDDDGVSF